MWQVGSLLKSYLNITKQTPHSLYREIYGKSEGVKNITQRSYISREFLGRCFRVHEIFVSQDQLSSELSSLLSVTIFKESMPFFDNPSFKLSGDQRTQLLDILNGRSGLKDPQAEIHALQKRLINKSNPRTQRLEELSDLKQVFIDFYNHCVTIISEHESLADVIGLPDKQQLISLAKNVSALSQEGLKTYPIDSASFPSPLWSSFCDAIMSLLSESTATRRRRLRRLIPAIRIVRLADILHALSTDDSYRRIRSELFTRPPATAN